MKYKFQGMDWLLTTRNVPKVVPILFDIWVQGGNSGGGLLNWTHPVDGLNTLDTGYSGSDDSLFPENPWMVGVPITFTVDPRYGLNDITRNLDYEVDGFDPVLPNQEIIWSGYETTTADYTFLINAGDTIRFYFGD